MTPANSLFLSTQSVSTALRHPAIRNFSTTRLLAAKKGAPPKPLILEKPLKFNPPSHGARLPRKGRMPQHYGGSLSKDELKAQELRDYPTMLAPKGTWAHWFWTNRMIHVIITTVGLVILRLRALAAATMIRRQNGWMRSPRGDIANMTFQGTLLVLGISTYFMNFAHTSPFKHLLPPISEFSEHPIDFIQTYLSVLKLHNQHNSQLAFESRSKKMDDVLKRQAFQRAHNSEKGPIEKYFGLGRKEPEPDEEPAPEAKPEIVEEEKPKNKFGIF
ncbi:hypothetical protein jhhlp_005589 [Lomentospora prolificans]|uniref:Uncharacterized protein n=1 Tax=Lomentospora prolificans TaxID=41688 RepID=A0A2N3N3L0_9PEZI|nr:hypothetical protein jhhlp_005589 [Lomentospora prolificans]